MATFLTAVVSIKATLFSFQPQTFTSLQSQTNALSLKPSPSFTKPISVSLPRMRLIPHATMETETETETEEKPALDPNAESSRRVYIGNIPRTVTNEQLTKIVEEHGAVEQVQVMYDKYSGRSRRFGFATMKSVEDANAVIEKLNGTTIEGREVKVNITEKPIASSSSSSPDLSLLQSEDAAFVDSPYKVYVGNLAKSVTKEMLESLFSEKGKVLSAKVSRVPGTSKSTGFGFVTFSSDEDVEAAILALNNSLLEGQKIRVNKA
ncbi:PREDICTED: 30S ribosomal protein 2, chloroplastic-like [Brassica oleracea var. oleracea]|uniref:Small ribosomal subunit protein cS22 n=1 Tax=Brassica oleracea var. oleracea TaxID=109376 RepID=A0A0D3BYK4_BRAOL|nr:PREDICTED: 30S ribosomal protein 2, chloroplastic-like [Brassica oleracea var. oleracea]